MTERNSKGKICIVTTIDLSLDKLFPDFYSLLLARGYEAVGICADGPYLENVRRQGVRVITVPMTRSFTPWLDLKCLWKLYQIFRRERFDIIHYSTPKAALLTGLAGRAAHCPALLYTLRGLGYTAFNGIKRVIGKYCEKIACHCAHRVIAISNSLKEEAAKGKLLPADQMKVLGAGSSIGVNLDQFQLNKKTKANTIMIRRYLGIGENDIIVGYAGRLTKEKGILELLAAFGNIRKSNHKVHMILFGDQDQRKPLPNETLELINEDPRIHLIPFTENVQSYIAAMDIFVLASYREGFGNVLIEASAMERPVIGTDIIGCRDAVINGKTGLLVKPRDAIELEKALKEMIENPFKRAKMGRAGRQWVIENFDRRLVWNRLIKVYERMLH